MIDLKSLGSSVGRDIAPWPPQLQRRRLRCPGRRIRRRQDGYCGQGAPSATIKSHLQKVKVGKSKKHPLTPKSEIPVTPNYAKLRLKINFSGK
jgi:hypothetical protein